MSFLELRRTVANARMFSVDEFAEDVTRRTRGQVESTIRVKIEQETRTPPPGSKLAAARDNDGAERIRVVVCRDETFAGCMIDRPEVSEAIIRDASRDPDARPYAFTGECPVFCPTHAVYIYQRSRRQITTRG